MAKTITSANSVLILAIPGLFDVPQQLQGFMADNVFETDSVSPGEVVMGVDGNMSYGWAPVAVSMNISIMPDSPSSFLFDTWYQQEQTNREKLAAQGSVFLPSIGRKYNLIKGVLTGLPPIPAAQRMLQGRRFTITWQQITAANG